MGSWNLNIIIKTKPYICGSLAAGERQKKSYLTFNFFHQFTLVSSKFDLNKWYMEDLSWEKIAENVLTSFMKWTNDARVIYI